MNQLNVQGGHLQDTLEVVTSSIAFDIGLLQKLSAFGIVAPPPEHLLPIRNKSTGLEEMEQYVDADLVERSIAGHTAKIHNQCKQARKDLNQLFETLSEIEMAVGIVETATETL